MNHVNNLPIGIFDSGVGGLTVLKAIHQLLPYEDLLYLGDTARLPYGTKSSSTVASYALQATRKLVEKGIKALVIACNTATAAALPTLENVFSPLPVIGVIIPGATAAVQATNNGHIAVIATEGTIKGLAYHNAINSLRQDIRITAKACTLFVHLAEEGWMDGSITQSVAKRYLEHIFLEPKDCPDTLLLGCTHFPPLSKAIQHVIGSKIQLVDSAITTANAVQDTLKHANLLKINPKYKGNCHFTTTDDCLRFAKVGSLFLGETIFANDVEHLDL